MRNLAFGVAALLLAGCGSSDESGTPEPLVALTSEQRATVCRTAIADMNGQSPSIVEVQATQGDYLTLRYVRPSDGKTWVNDCRIAGSRIIWRMIDVAGPGTGPGRWRDGPDDETVTFEVAPAEITITTTFPGEEPVSKLYPQLTEN